MAYYEEMGRARFLFTKWDFSSPHPFVYFGVIYGTLGVSHVITKAYIYDSDEDDGTVEIIPISDLENSKAESPYQLYQLRDKDKMMTAINRYINQGPDGSAIEPEEVLCFDWVPEVMDYRMSWRMIDG